MYKVGDKVLGLATNGVGYAASIIEVKNDKYLVHYKQWNSSYDEWLGPERLLMLTDENMQLNRMKIKELRDAAAAKDKAKQLKSSKKGRDSSDDEQHHAKKQRILEDIIPVSVSGAINLLLTKVRFTLHLNVKKMLVEDWDYIVNKKCVVNQVDSLDSSVESVVDSFIEYLKKSASNNSNETQSLNTTIAIFQLIKQLLEENFSLLLLYESEKTYMEQWKRENSNVSYSKSFPFIYLLRFLVRFPELIVTANKSIDENQLSAIANALNVFFKWFGQKSTFSNNFSRHYKNSS
jgi:mortality factor 4-like protein 1